MWKIIDFMQSFKAAYISPSTCVALQPLVTIAAAVALIQVLDFAFGGKKTHTRNTQINSTVAQSNVR